MAPLPPSKMRAAGASTNSRGRMRNSLRSSRRSNLFDDVFRTSKKDKRIIKHSTFMHKIEKSHKKTTTKRRRPSKKLVADLESLAEALPANFLDNHEHPQVNIIKHKTLKNRPGAMKRKEKLEQLERDRFMKNMAQMNMMAPSTVVTEPATNMSDTILAADEQNSTSGRWAALRNFINQTMDRQPAFNQK